MKTKQINANHSGNISMITSTFKATTTTTSTSTTRICRQHKQQQQQQRTNFKYRSNAHVHVHAFLLTILLLLSSNNSNVMIMAQNSTAPTPSPSASPSSKPTPFPTTKAPTFSPTSKPSPSPSAGPSVSPTVTPTTTPSNRPSPRPSVAPTSSPTASPTAHPTVSPSGGPSFEPTLDPSAFPTVVPTNRPTLAPTVSPTTTPSSTPTVSPTVSMHPSNTPSEVPSESPTALPSDVPTSVPTPLASEAPSVSQMPTPFPTAEPTRSPIDPTGYPSPKPSVAPSASPTVMPTGGPSAKPSSQPSAKPSATPTSNPTATSVTAKVDGISMTLQNITTSKLENEARAEWAIATEQHIVEFYNGFGGQEGAVEEYGPVQILKVVTTYEGSVYVDSGRRSLRNRYLEETNLTNNAIRYGDLTIQYSQSITYRTDSTLVQPSDIASDPFATRLRREQFIDILKTSSNSGVFDDLSAISAVSVEPPVMNAPSPAPSAKRATNAPNSDEDDNGGGSSSSNLWIIIGSAIGVAVVMAAAATGYLLMNKRERDSNGGQRGRSDRSSVGEMSDYNLQVSGDDHSTLAEPTPRLGVMSSNESLALYGDQSITTQDYDYAKAYGNTSVSSAGGTFGSAALGAGAASSAAGTGDAPSFFTKDPTFDALYGSASSMGVSPAGGGKKKEEVIDVYCPPGKLGVVIDTPDDGPPVVHAVKDSSVVADQVKVGDKVVCVDDEDVQHFTAIKVSKMISRKSANPTRKLTLIRTTMGP